MLHSSHIEVSSRGFSDVIDITGEVESILYKSGLTDGIVSVFVPGSTASITTIEYESGVIEDLKEAIEKLVPSDKTYKHDRRWGDGNGFSHVRAALLKPGLTIPFLERKLALGTWQQIVFIDFDNRPRRRSLVVQVVGG
jgi:secondary thiamine-phosphate synthase enzyme